MEYKKEMIHYTAVDEALVTIADAEKWYIQMFPSNSTSIAHFSWQPKYIIFQMYPSRENTWRGASTTPPPSPLKKHSFYDRP